MCAQTQVKWIFLEDLPGFPAGFLLRRGKSVKAGPEFPVAR
jgi:hypothetical protein